MTDRTLNKNERLRLKRQIECLFEQGRSVRSFPIRTIWTDIPYDGSDARMLVSVPKKHFKHAVDRNLVKRRIRAAYRECKHLVIPNGKTRLFAFVCVTKQLPCYAEIASAVRSAIEKTYAG